MERPGPRVNMPPTTVEEDEREIATEGRWVHTVREVPGRDHAVFGGDLAERGELRYPAHHE